MTRQVAFVGLDHRLVQLLAVPASSGLPALILSGQDGLTTHLAANVGEGMIEARSWAWTDGRLLSLPAR